MRPANELHLQQLLMLIYGAIMMNRQLITHHQQQPSSIFCTVCMPHHANVQLVTPAAAQ
jgi:hypothetical protein